MPLFSDRRGRFFALSHEILERYRLPDAEGGEPVSAPPASPGATVIIITPGAPEGVEGGGADA
jgi:hypothetical protein